MLLKCLAYLLEIDSIATVAEKHFLEDVLKYLIRAILHLLLFLALDFHFLLLLIRDLASIGPKHTNNKKYYN